MSARELRLLSVVAPMLDEEGLAAEFCSRVASSLEGLPYELVIVDDGSSDATPAILDGLAVADPRVRVLHLSRPFGHQMAITAGLDHARGDAVVMIDGDLQDPPELIPELVRSWRDGADIVVAKRRFRSGETRFKLATARWFYGLMGRLAQVDLEPNAGDFRLIDRAPLDALLRLRERSRFLRGMSSWVGFSRAVVEYDRDARTAGDTKYPLGKMLRFALDGLTSFSNFPLQLAALAGFACAALALLGLPLTIVARYSGIYERGVPSLLFAVLLIGGIQLLALGMLGEYMGRIYDEVKQRPLYVVARSQNLDPEEGASAALAGVERRDPEAP
jgi:polyisoprenyl-phosphate glycosyltransferase